MIGPNDSMKYYVYISDTKLDMLSAGIPIPLRKRIVADLSLDLKIVAISLKHRPSEETRYTKLRLVTKYIDDNLEVGTVDEPNSYFRGSLLMRWGPYQDIYSTGNELVFFGASTNRTILGLGGSMRHVIGDMGSTATHSDSATPFLLRALSQELKLDTSRVPDLGGSQEQQALFATELAVRHMPGPGEPLEFLARKLLGGSTASHDRMVLLGTPIYVARVDD